MKKYYKNIKFLIIALAVSFIYLAGCDEDDVIVTPPPPFSSGSADFSMYVSIGNSLTAGFQSNALSKRDQVQSFTSMLSKQFQRTSFEQPLIKNPGIGGRLRLLNLAPTIISEPSVDPTDPSSNENIALPRPYNNLGIPGSILFDMADETDFGAKSVARGNPFFALVLRQAALGSSVINQAKNLAPTFITAWIGNNDVLGYATSGGTSGTNAGLFDPPGTLPTEPEVFSPLYTAMLDSLAASGADIVVANIPDVSTIPFFTTVGPRLSGSVPWAFVAALHAAAGLPATGIIYVSSSGINIGLPFNIGFADSSAVRNGTALFTLTGQTYAALLGTPTGKFYTDNGFPALPPGIDTTQAFGFHPQNPFPDAFVLDPAEITIAKDAVDAFNGIISAEAGSRDIAVVDVNLFLKNLIANPISVPGIGVFTSSFITGGTFSYDGVHPSSRGYGIIANEWIKVINQKFGSNISPVDLTSLPGMPMGKIAAGTFPEYPAGYYNNMIRMITGDTDWPVTNR